MDLCSNLRDAPVSLRGLRHEFGFVGKAAHRFLAIDIFARDHRLDGDNRVPLRGRADNDGVNRVVFKEFAIIVIAFGFTAEFGDGASDIRLMHITNRDNFHVVVFAEPINMLAIAAPADADNRELNFVVCRNRHKGLSSPTMICPCIPHAQANFLPYS